MRILITGGAGFIGSAVIRQAIKEGHSIINIDALTYAACLDNLASVSDHPNYSFEHADIRNSKELHRIFRIHQPDAVMHLAAESHVDRSIDSPAQFIDTNIVGTYQLLDVVRSYWAEKRSPDQFRFHHVSTDEVYGSLATKDDPFTETSRYMPNSPYSASKAASDHLVRAWHSTYDLPTIITNCSNNYGPFHFPEKLIPVVILKALAGEPIPVYGKGENIRDWLYVEDHADALLTAMQNGRPGATYNIGGENEISNIDLVRMLCGILDCTRPQSKSYSDLITFVADRPGHDMRYSIDPTLMREELGWRPKTNLMDGLEKTVKWYLDNSIWWQALQNRDGVGRRLGNKS